MENQSSYPRPPKPVARQLVRFFARNGYVRGQNRQRVRDEGWDQYKKGHEVRLIAGSKQELALIQDLLEKAGFKPGRPFEKGAQYCQPVYGRRAVVRFLQMVGDESDV